MKHTNKEDKTKIHIEVQLTLPTHTQLFLFSTYTTSNKSTELTNMKALLKTKNRHCTRLRKDAMEKVEETNDDERTEGEGTKVSCFL